MLGIRRYQGASIDLYVGDPALFVCDVLAVQTDALQVAEERQLRHVALHDVPLSSIDVIKDYLDGRKSSSPARITIVLPNLQLYRQFQAALFATFPEEN